MTLSPEERAAIVAYRIEKAHETFKEAIAVNNLGYWSLAANRLYYAAYYASVAILIKNGIESNSHKGVIRMIGLYFVKNNILEPGDAKLLGKLYTMRQTGDYDDLFDWKSEHVAPLIPQVEEYILRIENILSND